MNISGINGNSIGTQSLQFMMNQGADSYSKGLQEQITNAQKQMQELGDNKEMSSEEKMKRRQEIQQQISDLQNQLRQHQIEQRKENQQKSDSSENDKANAGMKDIISAGSSLQQIKSQGAVNSKAQDRARVLESEIKTDSARGVDTSRKQEELSKIKSNTGWQMTDEYLPTEPVKGLYKPGKGEDGNPKIDYVDPNKELSPKSAKAQESSEEPENSSSATTDTDRVDREIEKLKEKKARLQQEVNSADESEKQRLQQELLQVEAELAQKDNDAYRRQNAVVS